MNIDIPELNFFEKMIKRLLTKYTYKVYNCGVKRGFNWNSKTTIKHIKECKKLCK